MYTTTGFKRKLSQGKIRIPQQFLEELSLAEDEEVKLYLDGNTIIIEPTKNVCIFCQSEATERFYKHPVCSDCIASIALK